MPIKAEQTTKWGAGRVAFLSQIDEIRAEIANGWPLTKVYAARQDTLGIVGYAAFRRLVSRYAGDARPKPTDTSSNAPNRGKPNGTKKTRQKPNRKVDPG